MVAFTIHDSDGLILCSGDCPESMLADQLHGYENGILLFQASNPRSQYVKDGEVIDKPPRPSNSHVFDPVSETWQETLAPTEAIKRRRDQAIKSGITVSGLQIATDEVSQQRIMGAAVSAMLDPQYAVQWKVTETDFVTLTATEILQIAQLVRAHVQACFDNEATLLGLVQSGQPFDIESGWP